MSKQYTNYASFNWKNKGKLSKCNRYTKKRQIYRVKIWLTKERIEQFMKRTSYSKWCCVKLYT